MADWSISGLIERRKNETNEIDERNERNQRNELRGRVLNLPNLFSLLRLCLLPLILYLLLNRERWWALSLMLIAGLTDVLDGYLARRFHQETSLGQILDPVVDKVSIGSIVVVLAVVQRLPSWLAVAIIVRDLAILLGSYWLLARRRLVLSSNPLGKATGICFSALILIYTIELRWAYQPLVWITTGLIGTSIVGYGARFFKTIHR